jgi:predicted Co/Zn/Cd cation transporter (cation efflux family)
MAVLLSSLLGWLLGALLGLILRALDFDKRLQKWGFVALAEWSPKDSPTLLLRKAVAWTVVVLGWLVGLTAFGAGVTPQLILNVVESLPNLGTSVVLVLLGFLLARFLARAVLISAVNMQIQSARLLSLAVKWLVLVFAAAMALDHLHVGGDIVRLGFAILFGGIVLALALAIGLGSKEIVSRSWERQSHSKAEPQDETLKHL